MYFPDKVINPRKLAAIHIVTMGPTFAIGNFSCTGILCLSLGVLSLRRADSIQMFAFACYFFFLCINYAVMLFFALDINDRERARSEIGDELESRRGAIGEYRRQSIYLLLPLVVPVVALRRHSRF